MSITPPVGSEGRPAGEHTCGFSPTLDYAGHCGKPATWHVIWTVEMDNTLCCDEHMADALIQWVFFMRHPIGPDCTMPDALFYDDRCEIPRDDQLAQAATAARGEAK